MSAFTWIGISLFIIGGGIIAWVTPTVVALQSKGLPGGKYRTRHGIGIGIASIGAVLMNIGTLTSDLGAPIKVLALAATLFLLGTLVWATAQGRNRKPE